MNENLDQSARRAAPTRRHAALLWLAAGIVLGALVMQWWPGTASAPPVARVAAALATAPAAAPKEAARPAPREPAAADPVDFELTQRSIANYDR